MSTNRIGSPSHGLKDFFFSRVLSDTFLFVWWYLRRVTLRFIVIFLAAGVPMLAIAGVGHIAAESIHRFWLCAVSLVGFYYPPVLIIGEVFLYFAVVHCNPRKTISCVDVWFLGIFGTHKSKNIQSESLNFSGSACRSDVRVDHDWRLSIQHHDAQRSVEGGGEDLCIRHFLAYLIGITFFAGSSSWPHWGAREAWKLRQIQRWLLQMGRRCRSCISGWLLRWLHPRGFEN